MFMFSSIMFNQLSFFNSVSIQFALKSVTYTYLSKVFGDGKIFSRFLKEVSYDQ